MENNSTKEVKDNGDMIIQDLQDKDILPKVKPKRQQSEAQKANTQKMRDALIKKHEAIRAEKAKLAEDKKKAKEERIVKKAIHIKKKEIKEAQELAISDEEDDDSEIEATPSKVIKPIVKAPIKTSQPIIKKPQVRRQKPIVQPLSDEDEEEDYYEAPVRHTPLQQHLKKNFPFIVTYI